MPVATLLPVRVGQLWCIDPHPNSAVLFVHLYRNTNAGAFINVITLKVTQIAALMAGTLMILIW